jgi:hypothetical protein
MFEEVSVVTLANLCGNCKLEDQILQEILLAGRGSSLRRL